MILLQPTTYHHPSGLSQLFEAGQEAPGDGWRTEPYPAAPPRPEPAPDPFDHDGDGQPGGSLPKVKRQYTRKAK